MTTHLQGRAQVAGTAGNTPLDVPGPSAAHAGDEDHVVEKEEAAVLPDPGTGAGGHQVVAQQSPSRGDQVVVSEAVDENLQLAELLLPHLLLVALLLHVVDLQSQRVDLLLGPPQQGEVSVVGLRVLHQALKQTFSAGNILQQPPALSYLEEETVARDPLEWFGEEVGQTEPLHLASPHVLQEPVKGGLRSPGYLDGVISSLHIANKPGVGIHHALLSELELEMQVNGKPDTCCVCCQTHAVQEPVTDGFLAVPVLQASL